MKGFPMKRQLIGRVAMPLLLLAFSVLPAFAQSADNLLTVQVPFAFYAGETLFPAGEYVFKRLTQTPNVLVLERPGDSGEMVSVVVLTHAVELVEDPVRSGLIFRDYGEKRFLAEVKASGRGSRYLLSRSKTEVNVAQTAAARILHAVPSDVRSRRRFSRRTVSLLPADRLR
jgi:hypothetical protein